MAYIFEGVVYENKREMCAARRRRYVELVDSGMNYTQAALSVGVSKRTGKVWRNGRTRATGRNEAPCREWTETARIPRSRTSAKPVVFVLDVQIP